MSRLRFTSGDNGEGSSDIQLSDLTFGRAIVRTPQGPRLGFIPRYLPGIYRESTRTTVNVFGYDLVIPYIKPKWLSHEAQFRTQYAIPLSSGLLKRVATRTKCDAGPCGLWLLCTKESARRNGNQGREQNQPALSPAHAVANHIISENQQTHRRHSLP